MENELKLIVELFSKVTDGALVGGLTYLILSFLQAIFPWSVAAYLGGLLINRLPKVIKITEK